MAALIEQHVDDPPSDFYVENSANTFKDFVGTFFNGTVGAGLAYLQMVADGYLWVDHFDKLTGSNKGPDFAFERSGATDVALMESKGTRARSVGAANSRARNGYLKQVRPYLGTTIGKPGSQYLASHGFCIASSLSGVGPARGPSAAEFTVHYTDPPSPGGGAGGGDGGDQTTRLAALPPSSALALGNYSTVFRLVHGESLAASVRDGRLPQGGATPLSFNSFQWLGRTFITAWQEDTPRWCMGPDFEVPFQLAALAIAEEIAASVLAHCSLPESLSERLTIEPLGETLIRNARNDHGAVFPDGFAVVTRNSNLEWAKHRSWDVATRTFD
jgi:hypothetical protein